MYLTQIAKTLVTEINASAISNWGGYDGNGYIVGTGADLQAKFALDPFQRSDESTPRIFVIPSYIEFPLENVRTVKLSPNLKYVVMALVVKVGSDDATPTYDVTSEVEATKLVDLKEDLDNFLVNLLVPGIKLRDMETEPFDEIEMKDSYFIVTSVLGYATC